MPSSTESRIEELCAEAVRVTNHSDMERVVGELRAALDEHIRQAKVSLESQASASFSLQSTHMESVPPEDKLKSAAQEKAVEFLHLFIFQCRQCGCPITITTHSDCAGLELVGATVFSLYCRCGWFRNLEGMRARRHWVEPWPGDDMGPQAAS